VATLTAFLDHEFAIEHRLEQDLALAMGRGGDGTQGRPRIGATKTLAGQRQLVIAVMDHLLKRADFSPRMTFDHSPTASTFALRLDIERSTRGRGADLWSAILVGLCNSLASELGIAECDGCNRPYTPLKRRPRRDRRSYCPECSDGKSLASKRDYYRRKKIAEQRRGSQSGSLTSQS